VRFRIAAVDLISNTCFPALAADELGFFKEEGLDARIELVAMLGATKTLRDGSADAMIAGSVHDLLTEFRREPHGCSLCEPILQRSPAISVP
jgi:NitT/TauT family transport system substrate-binding protein